MCFGSHANTLADQAQSNASQLTAEDIAIIGQLAGPTVAQDLATMKSWSPVQAGLGNDVTAMLNAKGSTVGNANIPTMFQSRDPNNPFTPEELGILNSVGALSSDQQAQTLGGQMQSAAAQRGLTNSSLGSAILPAVESNRRASLATSKANTLGESINLGNQIKSQDQAALSGLMTAAYTPQSSQLGSIVSPISNLAGQQSTLGLDYTQLANQQSQGLGSGLTSLATNPQIDKMFSSMFA